MGSSSSERVARKKQCSLVFITYVVDYVDLGTGESEGLVFGAPDTWGTAQNLGFLRAPRFQFFPINYNFVLL